MTSQSGKQVVIRPTSNQNVREYHFDQDQTVSMLPYAEYWLPLYGSEAEFDSLGPMGKKLAASLLGSKSKESIERITFRPNSVRVYKAPNAAWTMVEESIVIPAIRSSIDPKIQPVQYGTTRQFQSSRELAGAGRH